MRPRDREVGRLASGGEEACLGESFAACVRGCCGASSTRRGSGRRRITGLHCPFLFPRRGRRLAECEKFSSRGVGKGIGPGR